MAHIIIFVPWVGQFLADFILVRFRPMPMKGMDGKKDLPSIKMQMILLNGTLGKTNK